jgi:hypothetical protein
MQRTVSNKVLRIFHVAVWTILSSFSGSAQDKPTLGVVEKPSEIPVLQKIAPTACIDSKIICPQELPDAPGFISQGAQRAKGAKKERPIAFEHKDKLVNRKFIIAYSVFLGSVVYDVEVTHQGLAHHKCQELNGNSRTPSRGNLYARQLPIFGVATALGLFMRAGRLPLAPYAPAITGTVISIRGGTQWFTHGCY